MCQGSATRRVRRWARRCAAVVRRLMDFAVAEWWGGVRGGLSGMAKAAPGVPADTDRIPSNPKVANARMASRLHTFFTTLLKWLDASFCYFVSAGVGNRS